MANQPRIGVSVLCRKGQHVLLVKRAKEPYLGFWSLPGGMVEFGETMLAAARRELFEETATLAELEAEPVEVFDIIGPDGSFDSSSGNSSGSGSDGGENPAQSADYHFVLAVFRGIHQSGEARAGDDAAEVAWVLISDLDAITLTPGTAKRIRRHLGGRHLGSLQDD